MKKWIDLDFEVGQEVYLITDNTQQKRIIAGFLMRQNGITYELACGITTSWHYAFEISVDQNVLLKTGDFDS